MKRVLSKILVNLLILTLVMPASRAAAAGGDDRRDASPSAAVATGTADDQAPLPARPAISVQAAGKRAIAEALANQSGPTPIRSKPANRGLRMQGGGKSMMVMGIVYTVVGIAGTVYMLKYMQKKQDEIKQQ